MVIHDMLDDVKSSNPRNRPSINKPIDAKANDKHESLSIAIEKLVYVESSLHQLLERITSYSRVRKGIESDDKMPSLQSVLDDSPRKIMEHIKTCHELIDDITEALFVQVTEHPDTKN